MIIARIVRKQSVNTSSIAKTKSIVNSFNTLTCGGNSSGNALVRSLERQMKWWCQGTNQRNHHLASGRNSQILSISL